MKRIICLITLTFFIASCGPSKTVLESRKVIKGYWNLDNITYDTPGKFNVTLFNDVSASCMEGSTWRFIPNNNTGTYTIEKEDCNSGERYFIFNIQEIDAASGLYDFMLKPTNEKKKSESGAGFRIRLAHLDDSVMRWEQTVTLDGEPFKINMNFSKE